jgi:hypothetical protein
MARTKPALIFTLVHGTFSKGAPWVKDDGTADNFCSRLRAALAPEFDVKFERFRWGYDSFFRRPWDNTLSARRKGTDDLIKQLKDTSDRGAARRYLVAHSHGGNIALHALKDNAAKAKVDGLICLATPCLYSKFAPFRPDLVGLSAVALVVTAFDWSSRLPLGWGIALWTYTIIYLLMVLLIIIYRSRTTIECTLEQVEAFKVPRIPSVWFLRVPDDEVGALMSFSYRVGKRVRASWQLVNRIGAWFLWVYFLILFPGRQLTKKFGLVWPWLEPATILFYQVMTPIAVLATPFLMAMVILRLSFAFDSIRWVPTMDIWSEPVPWKDEKVELVSLDPRTRGLFRHTKIQGPAIARIADLVRASPAGVSGTDQ